MLTESRDRKSPATGTEILASAGSRASAPPATEVEAASCYARAEKAPATIRASPPASSALMACDAVPRVVA